MDDDVKPFERFGVPAGAARGNPVRRSVLAAVADIRREGVRPGTPWGGVELMIPELDYAVLTRRFPDLGSPDHEIRLRAWKGFLATSAADPYRVRPRNLARS